jgi:protoheme ferro-lyase
VPAYYRVPTVGTDRRFIAALAAQVREAAQRVENGVSRLE